MYPSEITLKLWLHQTVSAAIPRLEDRNYTLSWILFKPAGYSLKGIWARLLA